MIYTCKEVSRLVSEAQDRPLGLAERMRLRIHLAICDGCANFSRRVQFLRRAMTRLADEPGKRDAAES